MDGRPQDMMDNETSSKLLEFTLQFIQAGHANLSQFKIEGDCSTTTIILQFQNNLDTPLPAASLDSLQSASDRQSTKEMYSNEVPTESLRSNTFCDNNTGNSTNMCFEVNGTNKDLVIEQLSQLMHKYSGQTTEASLAAAGQQQTNNHSSQVDYSRDIKENNKNKANQLKGGEDNRNNEPRMRNANELVTSYEDSDALDIEKVMNEILIERSFQQMCQDPCYNVDHGNGAKHRDVPQCQRPKTSRRRKQEDDGMDACNNSQPTSPISPGCKCMDVPLVRSGPSSPDPMECRYRYPDSPRAMSVPPSPSPSPSGAFCYSIPEEPEQETGARRDKARGAQAPLPAQYSSKYPPPLSPTVVPLSPTVKSKLVRSSSQKSQKSRHRQRVKDSEQPNNCDSDTGSLRSDTASLRTDEEYDTMDTRSSHSTRSTASSRSTSSATRQRLGAAGRRKAFVATRARSHAGTSMVTSFSSSIGTMSNPGDTALNDEEDDGDDDGGKDSDTGGDDFELLSDLSKHQKQEKKQFRRQKSIFGI